MGAMRALFTPRCLVLTLIFIASAAVNSPAKEEKPAQPQQFEGAQKAQEYLATARFGEAAIEYEKLLRMMPDSPSVRYNLGLALYMNGEIDQAIERYRQAIQLNPSHAKAYANLGMAYEKKGLKEEALDAYKTAVRLKSDSKTIRLKLAYFYYTQGMHPDAIKQYDEALRIDPEYADAYYWKARADAATGDFEDAWKCLHMAEHFGLEVDPAFREEMLKSAPEPQTRLPKPPGPAILTQEEVQAAHEKNMESEGKPKF